MIVIDTEIINNKLFVLKLNMTMTIQAEYIVVIIVNRNM